MKAFLTSLLFFTGALSLPINSPIISSDATLSKRSLSVPELPADPNAKLAGIRYPWPPNKDGIQTLRYCFKDQRSEQTLGTLFRGPVIDKWRRAGALYPNINLDIKEDSRCATASGRKFADEVAAKWPKTPFDALVISEGTDEDSSGAITPEIVEPSGSGKGKGKGKAPAKRSDEDSDPSITPSDASTIEQTGGGSFTTTGYDDGKRLASFKQYPNRMVIRNAQWRTEAEKMKLILSMAHELGHAIGLQHEHQRDDRDQFLTVNFHNMVDFDKLIKPKLLDVQTYPEFRGKSPRQRLAMVTSNAELADKLDFKISDWIAARPGHNMGPEWDHYVKSKAFDDKSIMLYDSYAGADDARKGLPGAVIVGRPPTEIFQGGDISFEAAGPSKDDVARVKQLYPRSKKPAGPSSESGSQVIAGPSETKSGKTS